MTTPNALPADRIMFLATGLAGSLLVNLSAQFPSANIADIQGGVAASADEASWILTAYLMASLVGVVLSVVLLRATGIRRYVTASAAVFAATALACANVSDLGTMIALRALQGFVAGGFGPAAFFAVFVVAGGPRLPFGVTLLAFVLLAPGTIGPVISGYAEQAYGWQALFLLQAGIGAALAVAGWIWLPRQPADPSALKTDWVALGMLSLALAASALVLNQGTRRFWFENGMIATSTAVAVAAWAGFAFLARFSPRPIIAPRLLVARRFGLPIALNLLFRSGLVVTAYLVPQFLAVAQGYRPREVADLMLWAAIPQILALPLVWRLMHLIDARLVMTAGLVLCAAGTAILAGSTSLSAAEQFRLTLVLFGAGQLLFLAPVLVVGSTTLKPADLPTASLAFNITTTGGTTLGVGLVSHLATEMEKLNSNVISETVSLYSPLDADRIGTLAAALANRLADDAAATASAVGLLASTARREAWVLAFNDAFLAVAAGLTLTALAALAIGRSPRLRAPRTEL